MRIAAQLFFLFFYVASTYATTQEKLADTIRGIQHLPQDGESKIGSDCKAANHGLPKYREAKKVNKDFENRPAITIDLAPASMSRQFTAHNESLKEQFTLDKSNPRAPPIFS